MFVVYAIASLNKDVIIIIIIIIIIITIMPDVLNTIRSGPVSAYIMLHGRDDISSVHQMLVN